MDSFYKTLLLLSLFSLVGYSQNLKSSLNKGIFENPPDSIPIIFGDGFISVSDRYEYGLAISPSYDEIFFTAVEPGDGLMWTRKTADGEWTEPEMANLRSDSCSEFEAFYTKDGMNLYFSSNVNDTSRLWSVTKIGSKWTNPKLLESPVNGTRVFWATFSQNNTMYYSNLAVRKIYKSQLINNEYKTTENIGLPFGVHPTISSDESFILFNFRGDIYVAFNDSENHWSEPIKIENQISTHEFLETCPSLSPDEKYIFFSRYNDLNKKSNIYWVSSSIIRKIKQELSKM